jgi:hypothetical protein
MKQIHGGALGRILFARCSWNQGGLWHKDRQPQWSDMEWQLRNWLYFTWLSGDHIVEQHVHNLDVVNWAMQAHPVKARGMGGRQVRTDPKFGHIFDHHAVQYLYESGAWCFSECRQIDGCANDVSEHVYGTHGEAHMDTGAGASRARTSGPGRARTTIRIRPSTTTVRRDPRRQAVQRRPHGRREHADRDHGPHGDVLGQGSDVGAGAEQRREVGAASYEFGPLPVDPVPMPGQKKRRRRTRCLGDEARPRNESVAWCRTAARSEPLIGVCCGRDSVGCRSPRIPAAFSFHEKTMNRLIVTGAAALFLVACSKESRRLGAPGDHQCEGNVLELGKDI